MSTVDWKGMVWTLVRTDLKVRYHRTWAGFFWALLKPITMLLAMLTVFSFIFHREPNYKLNLILALLLWEYFAEATRVGLISLHAKSFLITKSRFPKWVVVLASLANPLLTLTVVLTAFLVVLGIDGRFPSASNLALFALYVFLLITITAGFALATSPLFLRYRDLNQIWDVLVSAGFFIAPVVFPLSILPEKYHFYFYLWPPTPVIQFARGVLIDGAPPTLKATLFLLAMSTIVLFTGVLVYRKYAPRAAEHL
jgi:lipopolysaccharide transport system permease protein